MKYSKVSVYTDAKKFIRNVTNNAKEDYFAFLFYAKETGKSALITLDEANYIAYSLFNDEGLAASALEAICIEKLYPQGFTQDKDSREFNHYPTGSDIDDILGWVMPLIGQEKCKQLAEHLESHSIKPSAPYDPNVEMRKKYPAWGSMVMWERKKHTINGKLKGLLFTNDQGRKIYLALHSGEKNRYQDFKTNSWCFDLPVVGFCRSQEVDAIGVCHRVGKNLTYYATPLEHFLVECAPHSTPKGLLKKLNKNKFLVNSMRFYDHVESCLKIK